MLHSLVTGICCKDMLRDKAITAIIRRVALSFDP
jgi:hypothetical protein